MKYEKRIGSNTPLREWFIPLPVNASFVDVVQIYDIHKNPSDIEYRQDVIDGMLKVDFMLEEWEGYVEYKYETDPDLDVDLPEWLHEIVHDHDHDHEHDHDSHVHVGSVTLEGDQVVIRIDRSQLHGQQETSQG
jgi:thiamine phosphate synthase YjbQ (UPF0047 family)